MAKTKLMSSLTASRSLPEVSHQKWMIQLYNNFFVISLSDLRLLLGSFNLQKQDHTVYTVIIHSWNEIGTLYKVHVDIFQDRDDFVFNWLGRLNTYLEDLKR